MNITKEQSEFIKVIKGDPVEIKVAQISWRGPAERVMFWQTYTELPGNCSDIEIQKEIDELLCDKKYFRKCYKCSTITPVGCGESAFEYSKIRGTFICHGCMTEHFNVLF